MFKRDSHLTVNIVYRGKEEHQSHVCGAQSACAEQKWPASATNHKPPCAIGTHMPSKALYTIDCYL